MGLWHFQGDWHCAGVEKQKNEALFWYGKNVGKQVA